MEARMRIVLIAVAIVAGQSLALAQAPSGTTPTQQTTTAPVSNPTKIEEPKSKIPPAANANRGLHVGKDALDAGPIEVKRNK
jgi:hypothetical protein